LQGLFANLSSAQTVFILAKKKLPSATSISLADTTIFSRYYNNRKTSILDEKGTPCKLAEAANKAHGAGAQIPQHRS